MKKNQIAVQEGQANIDKYQRDIERYSSNSPSKLEDKENIKF